jgi:serine/threonine protein kinase
MAKYGCFNCPEIGHDNTRELNHKCPTCGHTYGFPLEFPPNHIGKFEIIKSLSRGFYGSVYLVKDEILGKENVLKVIPKSIYQLHKKDFYKECKEHADLAKNSHFIVNISSAEETKVKFSNDLEIDSYVAVLDYLPGDPLRSILENDQGISSLKIAQIAIDLFRILAVLRNKQKNHNDLHPDNIIVEKLSHDDRRAGEIDERIRVVAIDIGSLTSENKAGDSPDRQGDIHWVANYLIELSEKLLKKPDNISDLNYRLASLLEDRAKLLFPAAEYQRSPNFDEIIESIKNCFNQQVFPWEEPLKLLNFNDTYNAQTLDPWFIPSLLVDPHDQWLSKISGRGPLVITGMRGCGKTMMLRSLQFHARAATAKLIYKNKPGDQIKKISEEGFVGVYVSCNKLLDEIGKASSEPLHQPFSRLFIRFGIEAIKALRHLRSIDESKVRSDYFQMFIETFRNHLSNHEMLQDIHSEIQLEQQLLRMIYSLNRGENRFIIQANPGNAFPALAKTIRDSSPIWSNQYVLFLLDDVSTRYLDEDNIRNLLSSLIFQSEECAFKITSEVQTIELVLFSPGKVEKAKKGRDFETFDLGAAVNQKIRNKGGRQFVADILNRRAKGNAKHPDKNPIELIGDSTLDSIAKSIVSRGDDKSKKKRIYHGLSALAGVCVGDIGDIINLYDMIIKHYDGKTTPISSDKQSESFQDLCSVRLHEVNKRGSDYKDFALSFAQASYELLMKSAKEKSSRLRQYYSIYIRITTGDMEKQYQRIRDLLDAGIFVYSGGASTPRTLGNDTNPINQFKLTYRKLYGVSNLIGLTQGDRFELSGTPLEEWLNNPANGKEILMKSIGGASSNVDEGEDFEEVSLLESKSHNPVGIQSSLTFENSLDATDHRYEDTLKKLIKEKVPVSRDLNYDEISSKSFDLLIAALGFEERTLDSITDLLKLKIKKILLIRYIEEGKSDKILELIKESKIEFEIVDYEKVKTSFEVPEGLILCDVTGMSKSLIFNIVRNTLKASSSIWIAHVHAEVYYPLNEQITAELEKYSDEDNYSTLEIITENVIKGEEGPYEVYDLLLSDTDESKRNVVIGFSSAKYERLFKVLESRPFDKIQIVTSNSDSKRAHLANLASEVITKSYSNVESTKYESNDLGATLEFLTLQYQKYYIDQNFNFELALTGSKRQTVACAAISAAFKISHCWYVRPHKWSTNTFSKGVNGKSYFMISLNTRED